MAIYIKIATDLRVKDLLPYMQEIEKMWFSHEIDSVNYGEGYELKYMDLVLRLYDDIRSDAVLRDEEFRKATIVLSHAISIPACFLSCLRSQRRVDLNSS